ncbi:hypothetical protein QOT17_000573 [Balamuthia mandrillaris]
MCKHDSRLRSLLQLLLVLTFGLFFLAERVEGQHCERWSGSPEYCAQFEQWQDPEVMIYVPASDTLSYLEEYVNQAINFVGAVGDDGSADAKCNRLWARLPRIR